MLHADQRRHTGAQAMTETRALGRQALELLRLTQSELPAAGCVQSLGAALGIVFSCANGSSAKDRYQAIGRASNRAGVQQP